MKLNILSKNGGTISFEKEIMCQWGKERYFNDERFFIEKDFEPYSQFSLHFLPIESKYANSFIEINADNLHFDDCTDTKTFSLIFKTKPTFIFLYKNKHTVSFFELLTTNNNKIIISCDSEDDRPYWFLNKDIDDVKSLYNIPLKIIEN